MRSAKGADIAGEYRRPFALTVTEHRNAFTGENVEISREGFAAAVIDAGVAIPYAQSVADE